MLIVGLTSACSSEKVVVADDGNTITAIKFTHNGAAINSRPNMSDICKGFLLSKKQVEEFFTRALYVKQSSADNSYNILPCYASGTALINDQPFNWTIKSGGIGEFTDKKTHFAKICGKGCCEKIPGVC